MAGKAGEILVGSWEWNKERFSSTTTLCWKGEVDKLKAENFFFKFSYFLGIYYPLGIFLRNCSKHLNCFWLSFSVNFFCFLMWFYAKTGPQKKPPLCRLYTHSFILSSQQPCESDTIIMLSWKRKPKREEITHSHTESTRAWIWIYIVWPQSVHTDHCTTLTNQLSLLACVKSCFLSCPPEIVVKEK